MLKGCVPWPPDFARRYVDAALWEGITVAEMVERTARRHPQKVAVVHGGVRTTYEELIRSAKGLACRLASLGLKPQDRVVARSVAGRGRSCRSDLDPSLMIRSVVGTRPVTNG